MHDANPPAMQAPLQDNLLDLLLAAIYCIVGSLEPVIHTIATTPGRPWVERIRIGHRFWAIIRDLLALTTRIKPESLSENPIFPELRPRAPRPDRARAPRPRYPTATLSPRQLALRLAALLHQLLCLAAEAGAALTATFQHNANIIRAIAGCDRLPPQTWERTG